MPDTHPDIEILYFTLHLEGQEGTKIPVKGVDKVSVKIPENSKYTMTVHFLIKNRELKDLKYKQTVKKMGVVVRQRDLEIGEAFTPSTEEYSKTFPEDETPGGWTMRGTYPCNSTYYSGDEELMSVDWTLEITKK